MTDQDASDVSNQRDGADRPPFKGLEFFDCVDADLFFGRELLTAKLAGLLRTQRFVAVVGASGSGKSSVVRAGLDSGAQARRPVGRQDPAAAQQFALAGAYHNAHRPSA